MIRPDPDTRAAWAALAGMYRWLYGQSLQERMVEIRTDVADWYWIGGKLEVPKLPARRQRDLTAGPHTPVWPPRGSRRLAPSAAAPTVAEPEPSDEGASPLSGRPPMVRDIIMKTALQTGVALDLILGDSRRWAPVQARHLCVRRLAALPWRDGHPSHQQIAQWMNMERTTVLYVLKQGA